MPEWAQGELAAGRVTIAKSRAKRSSESAASMPSAQQPVPTLRGSAVPLRTCSPRHFGGAPCTLKFGVIRELRKLKLVSTEFQEPLLRPQSNPAPRFYNGRRRPASEERQGA